MFKTRVGKVAAFALVLSLAVTGLVSTKATAATCPCNLFGTTTPSKITEADPASVELGLKFSTDTAGTATGVRFYKGPKNTGTHVGKLWTSGGTLLSSVTFANETASGWQQATFPSPVALTANTTYVVSYLAPVGYYSVNANYFATKRDVPPLHTPVGAGVYLYGNGGFPTQTYKNSNYWVDVVFNTTPSDTTPPIVSTTSPSDAAANVVVGSSVNATFNEPLATSSVNTTTFTLSTGGSPVAGAVTYSADTSTATFTPSTALAYSTTYTATIKGGTSGVRDVADNALAADQVWTFSTAHAPLPPATGKPVLLVTSTANPFTTYYSEILKGEGLNEYETLDVSALTASALGTHRAVVLGETSLTDAQVALVTDYVEAGGQLIAMRPDKKLASLLGLTATASTLTDQYLKLSSASAVTAGITQSTMQFHGAADLYGLSGATALGTLYSNATLATSSPAVTTRAVGANGGHASAFTYDLAKSVVYTRQGNPAWAGQNRTGGALKRADDMFYGNAVGDPQPDWVDLNKVQVPQADEQQHVLSNLLTQLTLDNQPLPKFWFLPNGKKAAVVMTGDDHGNNGTTGRFRQFEQMSTANCNVANWECIRGTSYVFPGTAITAADATDFVNKGFELGVHVNTSCADATPAQYSQFLTSQLAQFQAQFPMVSSVTTNRNHCIAWSDWNSVAKVESANGIRLDTNYYYFPPEWVQNRPGLYSGSGQLLKFADPDGTIVDNYQAVTQLTDESGQTYPYNSNVLLDNAVGPNGYYAIITANHHTDVGVENESTQTVLSAQARGIPVVSADQMLKWLDGRNESSFDNLTWNGNTATFSVSVGAGAQNLIRAMLPLRSSTGALSTITSGSAGVPFTVETIKGVDYAFFSATTGSYTATYAPDTTPPTVVSSIPANGASDVVPSATPVKATFSESLDATTVTSSTVSLKTAQGVAVSGSVGYDYVNHAVVFTPSAPLAVSTPYVLTVNGGTSGVKDVVGNPLASTFTASFTTAAFVRSTIFADTDVPANPSFPDTGAYTLGVKFTSDADGYITGIRYYRGVNNAGPHQGALWSSSGSLLASATFDNETSTGWQTVTFATPVAVIAGTTYVASYTAPTGGYAVDTNGLADAKGSGVLHSLPSATSGGNGVFATGATLSFPTQSFNSANYWVDAVYQSATNDVTAPTVSSTNPTSDATDVDAATTVTATLSENIAPASVTSSSLTVSGPGSTAIAGVVSYDSANRRVVFTPQTSLADSTLYTAQLSGVTDTAGNALAAPYGWSFTTAAPGPSISTLFGPTVPGTTSANDTGAVNLGVKFTSDVAGQVTGVRFYKGALNGGTHVGSLWSSNGDLLAQGTFANETSTGWQTLTFATPVSITAGTTYVVSYLAPQGGYAFTANYFGSAYGAGVLHAPAGANGVYLYGANAAFPTQTFNSANYWVDVVFQAS